MVIIPVHTHDTAGTGSGMPRYAKVDYCTCTRATRFGNTAGFSVPVLNPNCVLLETRILPHGLIW